MKEDSLKNINKLTTIAMISTIAYIGRMMFTFIPNAQPTTAIIIITTVYLGGSEGLTVAIISMFVSNLYLGMGPWTIAQIVSYSTIVGMFVLLERYNVNRSYYPVMAFISGMMFGFIISLVQAPFFGWMAFIPYWISGLSFDFSHAVGNYVFYLMLGPPLSKILTHQKKKYLNNI